MRSPACWTMPGHDLAHAVDVLVVHHLALGLADPLQDHLLRRLRGDAAEVLGSDVLALDLILRHLRPVELEVLVGEERVVLLAGLDLEPLELLDCVLARLLDEPLLEVARDLDRVDAEITLVVELDGGMARRARSLLVRGEERVLERRDERVAVDALLALDRANRLDDLSRHGLSLPFVDQVAPDDLVVRDSHGFRLRADGDFALARVHDLAAHAPLRVRCEARRGGRRRCGSAAACAAAVRCRATRPRSPTRGDSRRGGRSPARRACGRHRARRRCTR